MCLKKNITLIWLALFGVVPEFLIGQNISSPSAIVLPEAPNTSWIVSSGQNVTVVSGTSITLNAGTSVQLGAYAHFYIDPGLTGPVGPAVPDGTMNWTLNRNFRANGTIVAEQKSFYDFNGATLQQQYKNISAGQVLANQVIYDAAGRGVLNTLPAPTNNNAFSYKADFVQNPTGSPYSYKNFDKYLSGSTIVNKAYSPDAVGGKTTIGTLGWYYSNNNTLESKVATTDYPYSRQLYSFDGTGRAIKTGGTGDEYRVGKGHEPKSYSAGIDGELSHYLQVRNKFFSEAEIGNKPNFPNNSVLSVMVDENQKQSIYMEQDGHLLVSAIPGNELIINKDIFIAPGDITDNGSIPVFVVLQDQSVNFDGDRGTLVKLSEQEQEVSMDGPMSLTSGLYRFKDGEGATSIYYTIGLGSITYNFYNQLGQLVASIPPEGVKKLLGTGINNYTTKAQIPFITLYEYDTQGRLLSVTDPDAGKTEYVYRKDGNIRFSRNKQQLADGKFSYTNYDGDGRPVESGEYKPGSGGMAFNADLAVSSPMKGILENVSANGGLTNGTQYDVVKTKYDVVDNTHGLSGYTQDSYFMRGAVSMTEKYSSIVNNAPAAANLISRSWYSYDGQGQVAWSISYLNGLGYKTTDYSYDELGNTTKVVFQKNTTAETFVHYYEYDADMRLSMVYTNTTDNPSTKILQAKYMYYLHGPLKRVELADKLQGIDYVYTADGKLKTINHADKTKDPGNDGTANGFAPDVFGMNMEYHPNDYVRSGSNIASIQNASYPAQYNGNISGQSWFSKKPASVTGLDATVMNTYKYDDKYQFQQNGWGTPNFTANTYTETANVNKEFGLSYDGNGNIQALKRNNSAGTAAANYTYTYTANTNKLASVSGYASYTYDAIGRMASVTKGGVTLYLVYDVSGKVTKICTDAAKTQIKYRFHRINLFLKAGERTVKYAFKACVFYLSLHTMSPASGSRNKTTQTMRSRGMYMTQAGSSCRSLTMGMAP